MVRYPVSNRWTPVTSPRYSAEIISPRSREDGTDLETPTTEDGIRAHMCSKTDLVIDLSNARLVRAFGEIAVRFQSTLHAASQILLGAYCPWRKGKVADSDDDSWCAAPQRGRM